MQTLLICILLATLVLGLIVWFAIEHARSRLNDKNELDQRLRNISR
jgi:Tfp pilus assembly protein PilO